MRRRSFSARCARLQVALYEAAHLANVFAGGLRNTTNPVLPPLPTALEYRAYTAGRRALRCIRRAIYAFF